MIYMNISGFGHFRTIQVEKQPRRQQVSRSTHTTENRSLLSGLFSQTETHLWLILTQKHFCLFRVTQCSDCSGWFTLSLPWSSSPTDSGCLMRNETPEQTLQILWKNLACRDRKSQLRMSATRFFSFLKVQCLKLLLESWRRLPKVVSGERQQKPLGIPS